jgi:hypothetical protein
VHEAKLFCRARGRDDRLAVADFLDLRTADLITV